MKNKYALFFILFLLVLASCKKSLLNQVDPNQPSPAASLNSEGGLVAYGAGILQRVIFPVPNEGNSNILTVAMINQSILGDENFVAYGNYGFRWVDQALQTTLPDGTIIPNFFGVSQQVSLQGFNSRQAGDRNAFQFEWTVCYFFISQANTMLKALGDPAVQYTSGNATIKKATLQAWSYWWKGYSYSRLGSMYLGGVINNDPGNGNTNPAFVDHNALISEADKNFDSCAAALAVIDPGGDDDYNNLMENLILSFNDNTDIVTPAMWLDQINTYKARNLLVNKKLKDMGQADWQQIIDWCNKGLTANDYYFKFGMEPDGVNDLSNSFLHPLELAGPGAQNWVFTSERLIQDFKPGDKRFSKNFEMLPAPDPNNPDNQDPYFGLNAFSSLAGRGVLFGTRWAPIPIENGGAYATGANQGFIPFACTYEENALMLAEAYIQTGNTDQGLDYVDQVRGYQNAGLAAVSGTGLNLDQAKEELRRERRIGLYTRGLAFFDARRWGVTAAAADGGGRANAIVYVPGQFLNSAQDQALPCFIEYDYMDYWDVPQNELDFNSPATGSPSVKN
ncbi:MAG: RagB/SusD family nutrient uptake outer membrane protein [Puia sp.]